MWKTASDKVSWLGPSPICTEFLCYTVVCSLLLVKSILGKVIAMGIAVAMIAYCQGVPGKIPQAAGPGDPWKHLPCSLTVFLMSCLVVSFPAQKEPKASRYPSMGGLLAHICYYCGILTAGLLDWGGPGQMSERRPSHLLPLVLGTLVLLEHSRRAPPTESWVIKLLDGVSLSWMRLHRDVIIYMASAQSLAKSKPGLVAQVPAVFMWSLLASKAQTWMVGPYRHVLLKSVGKLEALAIGGWRLPLISLVGMVLFVSYESLCQASL